MKKIIMTMCLLVSIGSVNAYVFTTDFQSGFYWKTFPVGMNRFVADSSDGPLLEEVTRAAEEAWETVLGKNIWDFSDVVTSTDYSGNHIRWSNNFAADTGYDATKTLAVTIRYTTGTYIGRAVIILNGELSQLRQDWGGLLYKTVLHEMGHVIGLDHTGEHAIMAPYISELSTLQEDDVTGGNAVVSETLYRQSVGYISPSATTKEVKNGSLLSACGTIALDDRHGGGPGQFLISIGLGLMLSIFFRFRRKLLFFKIF